MTREHRALVLVPSLDGVCVAVQLGYVPVGRYLDAASVREARQYVASPCIVRYLGLVVDGVHVQEAAG